MITVRELIKELSSFNQEMEVAISYDGISVDEIDHVDIDEDDRAMIRPMGYQNLQ